MSSQKSVIPLKPINFEATARAVEKFAAENNIPTLTFPNARKRREGGAEEAASSPAVTAVPIKSRAMKRLPMVVPEYVIDSLKARAAQDKGASVPFVVLSALKAYGIEVDNEELVKDKRREAWTAS
jgi:hypothetical protein